MFRDEFAPPITSEAYAFARASLISRAFRDRIGEIEHDALDCELSQAYSFLDDLGFACCERALEGDADPEEVAEVYSSDTLDLLADALREATSGFEFHDEIARLPSINLLIAEAVA